MSKAGLLLSGFLFMSHILHIETTTTVCSVCLAKNGQVLSLREINQGYSHSENITVFIEEVLSEASCSFQQLSAVAVSIGPGSYTGLRIGLSTAKGLSYALNIPLITISTLHAMAVGMKEIMDLKKQQNYLLCPMIDARRMEVYCEVFDTKLETVEPVAAKVIEEGSFAELLSNNAIVFGGDGSAKCEAILAKYNHAVFLKDFVPSSRFMIPLAANKYDQKSFADTALSEPFYLKEFDAGGKKG